MEQILHALVPFAVFGFPATVAIAFRWMRHRERMAGQASAGPAAAAEARLVRLEQAMDAVMAEVERVGEGQRFVTRLLAERRGAPGQDARAARRVHDDARVAS
jgi:hypothetical protein